ncbi:Protein MICROTUBULE ORGANIZATION 1 [Sarracenia purpurea var. burkii]
MTRLIFTIRTRTVSEDEKFLKEAKNLSWEDRLLHKNYKIRNDANINLVAVFDSISDHKDSCLRELALVQLIWTTICGFVYQ